MRVIGLMISRLAKFLRKAIPEPGNAYVVKRVVVEI